MTKPKSGLPSHVERQLHWMHTPAITRHAQGGLLVVTMAWGLNYMVPPTSRVEFAQSMFPSVLSTSSQVPIFVWGLIIVVCALAGALGERLIRGSLEEAVPDTGQARFGFGLSLVAHVLLASIFFMLGLALLLTGLQVAHEMQYTVTSVVSAFARPILWGYIGWLHHTYARLPNPFPDRTRKKRRRWRLLVREYASDDEQEEEGGSDS
jgi:hypothetical protein